MHVVEDIEQDEHIRQWIVVVGSDDEDIQCSYATFVDEDKASTHVEAIESLDLEPDADVIMVFDPDGEIFDGEDF
jgi:hypothetical protein